MRKRSYVLETKNNILIRYNGELLYNGPPEDMSDQIKSIYTSLDYVATPKELCRILGVSSEGPR